MRSLASRTHKDATCQTIIIERSLHAMDYQPTPREARQANQKRKGRAVIRGGAKRLHLLTEIERARYAKAVATAR
jgi:hypothetical protein